MASEQLRHTKVIVAWKWHVYRPYFLYWSQEPQRQECGCGCVADDLLAVNVEVIPSPRRGVVHQGSHGVCTLRGGLAEDLAFGLLANCGQIA